MRTYFSRHTKDLAVDQPTRDLLWDEHRVAIHFPEKLNGSRVGRIQGEDNRSLALSDCPPGSKGPLGALLELGAQGGYVCAQHAGHDECLVGMVDPGTEIELLEGRWSQDTFPGRVAVLKSLRLRKVKYIHPSRAAVVLVGRPIKGTFSRWPNARDVVKHLVEGMPLPRTLGSLSPDQQEILCSEFLRSDAASDMGLPRLTHLLLPVGRTMKDIDIYGLDSQGRMVIAQVTHLRLDQAVGKLRQLLPYLAGADASGVLFCRHHQTVQVDGVTVSPIETVFERFASTAAGARWLSAALGGA